MPKVTALQFHTYGGKAYNVGDTYDAPDDLVTSLQVQGKASLADPAGAAKASAKATAATAKPAKKARKAKK